MNAPEPPVHPPSVAADASEGSLRVFPGTPGADTGALRAELTAMLADRGGPKVIWKFTLVVGKRDHDVLMPKYAKVIHVGVQRGHPVFWAVVDPQQPFEARRFLILATGQPIPAETTEYHGTVQMPYGLVWHVMEARTP